MAYTAIADIIDPEVLADQVAAKFPDLLVFGNSNLVETDSTFPLGSPGTEFKIPFWKRMGELADMEEGTPLDPGKITAAAEYATVLRGGAAYEVLDTAQLVSKADPVGEVSDQIARRVAEYVDAKLVLEAENTPNSLDITGETTKTAEAGTIIEAMVGTLGDNYAKLLQGGAFICHSKVLGDLLKNEDIQNTPISGSQPLATGMIQTVAGLRVIVSDRVTVDVVSDANHYKSYIVGPGALALWYQRAANVEFDRDILLKADIISVDVHFAPHLFGWDSKTSAVVAEDDKSIHAVLYITQ